MTSQTRLESAIMLEKAFFLAAEEYNADNLDIMSGCFRVLLKICIEEDFEDTELLLGLASAIDGARESAEKNK